MLWRSGDALFVLHEGSYTRVGPSGEVLGWYGCTSYSDEDDLWVTAPVVVGDQLVVRTTVAHGGDPVRVYEEKVLARGLRLESDPAAQRLAEAALAAAAVASDLTRAGRARAAEGRVTAIDGAREDLGLGADLTRAQQALGERVRRWDDELAVALLETLVVLGRSRPSAAATTAFARGCLLACFQHDVPELSVGAAGAPNAALAARVAAHADELERRAEGQELADAMRNAAAYAGAASAMRAAAAMLG